MNEYSPDTSRFPLPYTGFTVMPFQPMAVSAKGSSKSVNSLSTLIVATCCASLVHPP
jgi:hypothetical protein